MKKTQQNKIFLPDIHPAFKSLRAEIERGKRGQEEFNIRFKKWAEKLRKHIAEREKEVLHLFNELERKHGNL